MLKKVKKSIFDLWRLKLWLVIGVCIVLGLEAVASYLIGDLMGLEQTYSFNKLGQELSGISTNNPNYIYDTIVDGGIIIYVLAILTAGITGIYWLNLFLIKLSLKCASSHEVWVEDAHVTNKEILKSVVMLITVVGISAIVYLLLSITIFYFATIYEYILLGSLIVSVITFWVFTSMYLGTHYLMQEGGGIFLNIKKSISKVNSHKINFVVIIIFISILVLVMDGIWLLLVPIILNSLSANYVIEAGEEQVSGEPELVTEKITD